MPSLFKEESGHGHRKFRHKWRAQKVKHQNDLRESKNDMPRSTVSNSRGQHDELQLAQRCTES
jgi:hypothetical protein